MTDVVKIISKYINDAESAKILIFNELKQAEKNHTATKQQIAATIWTFVNLSKQSNTFNNDAYSRLLQLASYMSNLSKKYRKIFFLILDRADTFKFSDSVQLRTDVNLVSNSRYQFERFQLFKDNPEGFSHMLLILFSKIPNPSNLLQAIGTHNIDPNVIFNIIFHIITEQNRDSFTSYFSIFPLESILPCIFSEIQESNDTIYYSILHKLIQTEKLSYHHLFNITGRPDFILSQLHFNFLSALHKHSEDLKKVRTIEPTKSKRDSIPELYFKNEEEYQYSRSQLFNSVFFRLLAASEPFDFQLFKMISSFDPCLYSPISSKLSTVLFEYFTKDPISFLNNHLYLKYLCSLSSHCTENRLIYGICKYPNLIPPYLYSNFLLQSISTNSCGWQLSFPVFNCLKSRFSMDERFEIYEKFSMNQTSILDSIVMIANTIRKFEYILKRVTIGTYKQYSLKISKLFLRALKTTSTILLNYIEDDKPPIDVPFLIISDLSPLSLDYLFLLSCKKIEEMINTSMIPSDQIDFENGLNDSNEWPIGLSVFLGKTFSAHSEDMDLQGYLSFINNGLSEFKIQYVCLLRELIVAMTSSNYQGNLTKSEIEIRSSELLLSFMKQIEHDINPNGKEENLKRVLLNDDMGIKLLSNLDKLAQKWQLNNPDLLDVVRFTFISICDFLKYEFMNLSPIDLINKYHFSILSAIRISKGTYYELYQCKQTSIPSELFALFWNTTSNDFHFPEKKFIETKKHYDQQFHEFLLKSSQNEQKKRIQKLQKDIKRQISFKKYDKSSINRIYSNFVNECIVPRMLFSQEDSHFCSLFVNSLAHFTDFNFEMFNFYLTRYLHYLIIAATFEEARSIGLFLSKLLKFNRERYEEVRLHEYLMNKFELVLTHQSQHFEYIIMKTIEILDRISQDFPIKTEHEDRLFSLLNDINVAPKSSFAIQKRRYFDKRYENLQKRQKLKQKELANDSLQQYDDNNFEEEEIDDELPEEEVTTPVERYHSSSSSNSSKQSSPHKRIYNIQRKNTEYSPWRSKTTKQTRKKDQSSYNRDRYNRRYTRSNSHKNNSNNGRQTIMATFAPAETIESLVYSTTPIASPVGQFYSVPQYSSFYQTPQIIATPIINQPQQAEQVQYVIPVNTYQQPKSKPKKYYNKKRQRK